MLNISAIKVRVSLKWQRCFGGCDYMTFRLFLGESRVLVHGWDDSCDPAQEQGLGLGRGAVQPQGHRPLLSSKSWPWDPGVRKESCDGSVALGSPDHISNLTVQFHQLDRDFCQVLFWAHQSKSPCLAQGLMSEIDIEQSLDLVLWMVAKDVIWPRCSAK